MPEFNRAAAILAASPDVAAVVAIGTVNSVTERDLAERLGVDTFPTFFLYRNGEPESFPSLATGEAYVAGLARLLNVPGADALSPAKDVAPGTSGADLATWLFWRGSEMGKLATTLALYSPPDHPASPELTAAFDAAANELFRDPNLRFLRVRSPEAMADLEMPAAPLLTLYKDHDEGRVDFAGALTGAAVVEWVKRESVPLVTLITHKTLQRYRKVVQKLALLYVEPAQTEHAHTLRAIIDAAHTVVYALEAAGVVSRGEFTLGIVDGEKYVSWRAQFGIEDARLPTLSLEDLSAVADRVKDTGKLYAFPDAGGVWAKEALCGDAAVAKVGPHDKWTRDLSRSCPAELRTAARSKVFNVLPDGTYEVPETDLILPAVDDDKFESLVVSAIDFSDAFVEAMRAWLETALKGEAPLTRPKIQTPFGAI